MKNKDISSSDRMKAFGGGMAPTLGASAVIMPAAVFRRQQDIDNWPSSRRVADPIANKMRAYSRVSTGKTPSITVDTPAAGGFGSYWNKNVNLHAKNPANLTSFERGVLSHELGHHSNFSRMGKKGIVGYVAARQLAQLGAVGGAAGAAFSKDDKKAATIAGLASIPGTIQFGEEALATGRGLRNLSKSYGYKGGKGILKTLAKGKFGAGRSTLLNLTSYGAMAAAPGLAYALRMKYKKRREGMNKQAVLEEIRQSAFNEEIEMFKAAAQTSEEVMTGLGALSTLSGTSQRLIQNKPALAGIYAAAGAAPYAIGRLMGPKTKKQMAAQNKTGWVGNALVPFMAPYRLGRRHATTAKGYAKEA